MQKKKKLKKKLTNCIYKKKLELNKFGFILQNSVNIRNFQNSIQFSKPLLKIYYITNKISIFAFHFPLKFVYLKYFQEIINLLKIYYNYIINIKIIYKIFTKKKLNSNFFFSKFKFFFI